ncbi:MAG: tetratricopeptide repeat protein [candidate division Zixibacteria bacterium]|nr:tetratricopeptide repeat protein [candidate division Zixibacteria bacterium]
MEESTYVAPKVIRLQDQLVFAKVNGWEDTALARRYGIAGYPTIILLASTGEEIDRLWGYFPPDSFHQTVTNYVVGVGTLADLEKQLAQTPENIGLTMQVAEKYASRSRFEKSVELYKQVIAQDRENKTGIVPEAIFNAGDALSRGKKFMIAKQYFQTIVEKYPASEQYNDAVLEIPYQYEQAGDTATALKLYRQVQKDHPNHPDSAWLRKRIEKFSMPVKQNDK